MICVFTLKKIAVLTCYIYGMKRKQIDKGKNGKV